MPLKTNEEWRSKYPLNTFTGETRAELERLIEEELQKARHDWLREEIVKLEGMKLDCCAGIGPCDEICRATNEGNHTIQTIIDRYQEELDQPLPGDVSK